MLNRRRFLQQGLFASGGAFAALAGRPLHASASQARILDAHIHIFDPTRPGGVPWPLPGDLIDKPSLPARYETLARPLGVVGAIAIEASPLASDNDWLLGIVQSSPIMVGMIGDLVPSASDFAAQLERLHKNPLFLGIRHGNLWDRSISRDVDVPAFWTAMRQLSQAGLVLESANPDLPLLAALLKLAEKEPSLTVVIDHLPHMQEPAAGHDQQRFADLLTQFGKAPRTFAKLSEIPVQVDGRPVLDLAVYRKRLDRLWESFGPDKLIFGSDWPNSDHVATLPETFGLVEQYISEKDGRSREKFFFANSKAAYRWQPRVAAQS
jgi:L-fuconolactonase